MTEFAAVVLAHADPPHLRRLAAALEDVPVFLHVDARTHRLTAQSMLQGLPRSVTVVDSIPTSLASWSLVAAELAALQAAVTATRAEHIAVLSGSDYPLVSVETLIEELSRWAGHSYLWNVPMPFRGWNGPRHRDGGMWRLRRRFLTRGDDVVFWGRIPLRWPAPRALPPGIEARASSQWKIYARHHVELLLDVVRSRADLVRFWRRTLVPDETFVASVLGSRALVGDAAIPPCRAHPWFINWPERPQYHPDWLRGADLERLADARWADPIGPDEALAPCNLDELAARRSPWPVGPTRKLFARKFSSRIDPHVPEWIDAELRR